MDRYVIRERRPGAEYPQGNQMMPFSPSSAAGNNITIPDVYYGACEMPGVQRTGYANVNINTQHFVPNNLVQNPAAMVSGIDPRYLAAYSSNNGPFIAGQQMHQEQVIFPEDVAFGSNYQNRNLVPVEKVTPKPFQPQRFSAGAIGVPPTTEHQRFEPQPIIRVGNYANQNNLDTAQKAIPTLGSPLTNNALFEPQSRRVTGNYTKMKDLETSTKVIATNAATTRKQSEVNLLKNEAQSQVRTRSEKLKALHKSGPRAFSGPVEKVLKWHKSLQDIGLLVLYEIVAKCVSVRPGERCAKNIVVRDDSGPAMQVVYYEVDFLLPELKPPCTIRVIGRMIPGTCRLQAFNVRLATGDDVATLPRRAAVAAHHVAKLAKEYGKDSDKTTIVLP